MSKSIHKHKGRQFALACAAVLATAAVIAGLVLGTFGFVRTAQLAESNSANIARQCEALQVTIGQQKRGLRDGPKLFASVRAAHPQAFDKLVDKSRKDLRKLKRISSKLHCAIAPSKSVLGTRLLPDVVSGSGYDAATASRAGAQAVGGGAGGSPTNGQPPPSGNGGGDDEAPGAPGPTGPQGTPGAAAPSTTAPTPDQPGGLVPRATDTLCELTPSVCQADLPALP